MHRLHPLSHAFPIAHGDNIAVESEVTHIRVSHGHGGDGVLETEYWRAACITVHAMYNS